MFPAVSRVFWPMPPSLRRGPPPAQKPVPLWVLFSDRPAPLSAPLSAAVPACSGFMPRHGGFWSISTGRERFPRPGNYGNA
nr:MAG TPA: hypothetical protein [Caudoviricetes sp.]